MILIIIYLILISLNFGYIVAHNAMIEIHPKDDNDIEKLKYKSVFIPFFFIIDFVKIQ